MKLDMQIEAILKPKRGSRQKRKRKDDEDVLDKYADEEVSRLKDAMLTAAADDEQANKEKLPATSKLRLLPQVMEVLRKCVLPPLSPPLSSRTDRAGFPGRPSPSPSSTTTCSRA